MPPIPKFMIEYEEEFQIQYIKEIKQPMPSKWDNFAKKDFSGTTDKSRIGSEGYMVIEYLY